MGQVQHICSTRPSASRRGRWPPRVCLRKGCGRKFQPRCWNQRYCQDAACLREVHRWQAAKRQRWRRQSPQHRQQHCAAERERRKRRKEQAQRSPSEPVPSDANIADPVPPADTGRAWSRSKNLPEEFCNRPGCFGPVRCSCRAKARYCGDLCAQVLRRVLDRERKWLRRNTSVGCCGRQRECERDPLRRGDNSPPGYESPAACADS